MESIWFIRTEHSPISVKTYVDYLVVVCLSPTIFMYRVCNGLGILPQRNIMELILSTNDSRAARHIIPGT